MFTKKFDRYACEGDSIECTIDGFDAVARIVRDNDAHIDDDDCHNIDQKVTGCNEEQQAKLLDARKAYMNDEWFYCGIVVDVSKRGIKLGSASLWSIECNYPDSDNDYLSEVANELLPEAIADAKNILAELSA